MKTQEWTTSPQKKKNKKKKTNSEDRVNSANQWATALP